MEWSREVKCSAGAKGDVEWWSGDVIAVGGIEEEDDDEEEEEEGVEDDGRAEAVVGGLEGRGGFGLLALDVFRPLI